MSYSFTAGSLLAWSNLNAARWQMTVSLVFHIVFAAIGIGLPLLMVMVERRHLHTGEAHYKELARKWAKATGLLFAVGAVSGTALSFELGLLWPGFMEVAGGAVGHLFGLEGFAFFLEAIFIGLYLYGWNKLSARTHWWCGVGIAICGPLSGVLILGVSSWMQLPIGFTLDAAGQVTATQPLAVFGTYAWWTMALHSTLACYMAVGFAVASVYAVAYLRGRRDEYHRTAIRIALSVGAVAAILQPVSGDFLAKFVYRTQPAKFAAMEAHFQTGHHAPMHIGGLPDEQNARIDYAIKIPGMLSFLAAHDPSATVTGLNDIPRDLWPNVVLTHFSFDAMVGIGFALAALGTWFVIRRYRRREKLFDSRWFLRAIAVAGPLGFVALQLGWVVTESGRQPWIIQGVMKTAEAATPFPNVTAFLWLFTLLYVLLGVMTVFLLRQLAARYNTQTPSDTGSD